MRSAGPRVRKALVVPNNVYVTASTSGWQQAHLVNAWLHKEPTRFQGRQLGVLDRWGPHHTDEAFQIAAENNIDLVIIPGGLTGKIQPGDIGWNKPFKDAIRESWRKWMAKQKPNEKGRITAPTRSHVVKWVSDAWKGISAETIQKAFKIAGKKNAKLSRKFGCLEVICPRVQL